VRLDDAILKYRLIGGGGSPYRGEEGVVENIDEKLSLDLYVRLPL